MTSMRDNINRDIPASVEVRRKKIDKLIGDDISVIANVEIDGSVDPKCKYLIYKGADFK